ncbi:hypothetical protein H8D30_03410 [bacterium]|nr:hypothetical protein [bacterium]
MNRLCLGLAITLFVGCCPVSPGAIRAKERIEERYTIEVLFDEADLRGSFVTGKGAYSEVLDGFFPLLEAELGRYPNDIFLKADVRTILLGHHIRMGGQRVGGLAGNGEIYLTLPLSAGACHQAASTIHHEVFHTLEQANKKLIADGWTALNPQGFSYRSVDWWKEATPAGFVSRYATSNEKEDRAETFAEMVVSGFALQKWMGQNRVLRAKVTYLKQKLEQVDPMMGKRFWDGIAQAGSFLEPGGACGVYERGETATKGPLCRCAREPQLCVLGAVLSLGLLWGLWRVVIR